MSADGKPRDIAQVVAERLARPRSYRVILRACDTPDPDKIAGIVRESLQDLGVAPRGKVLIKPNVVTANRAYIHHSYTDPRLVGEAIKYARAAGAESVTVGESGGYGIPGRLFFSEAGYLELAALGAEVVDFNIEPAIRVPLRRGQHHKSMLTARSLHDADFLWWAPKLKYHICCTVTCALKLNVGILTHRERLFFHDDRLDEKIVDLLEIGYPDVVTVDAIEVGHGYESAPQTLHLGLIMVADDPVAADIVACRLLGFEPDDCAHLKLARGRGYGPPSLEAIKLEGDYPLEKALAITAGFESEYQDIQKVKTPIRFYNGVEPTRGRFCHGGCLAAVKGCLGTIDKRRPGSVARALPGAIVTGVYQGDVDAGGGTALLIGDCTRVEGEIRAARVRRVGGCPIGAKQLFFSVPSAFALPSPMLDPRDAVLFIYFSIDKLIRKALTWAAGLFGRS